MRRLKFLADENISPKIVEALRHQGYQVKDLKEEKLSGFPDVAVLALAKKENRIIITCDKDFGNLLNYPLQAHSGVILLRYSNLKPQEIIKKFLPALNSLAQRKLSGCLVIVTDDFVEILEKSR